MARWVLIIFLHILIWPCSVNSQPISFKNYTASDGLVANPVRCIYQDSKGFIWIGTWEGLSRYDGYKFYNYSTSNGLSHNLINSIAEIDGKLLITLNNGGIDIIQNNRIEKNLMAASAANMVTRYKGRVLLSTDGHGFYEYKNDTITRPRQQNAGTYVGYSIPLNDSFLLSDAIDYYLILYRDDLSIHSTLNSPGLHYYSLFQDSKKRVWGCTSQGLKLIQVNTQQKPSISFARLPIGFDFSPLNNDLVTSIIEVKDGSFWIGTIRGLIHVFPDGNHHVYTQKDGLPSAIVSDLYIDKENNLWVGTALGLAKWVSKNNVVFYNTLDGEFKNDITAIYSLNDRMKILGTAHGLQQFNVDTKEFKNIPGTNRDHSVAVDATNPLLFHFADKIGVFDSTKDVITPVKKLDTAITGVVYSARHPNGTILLGTFGGLLAVKETSVKKILPHRITSAIMDSDGNLWAGTWQEGLFRVSINSKSGDEFQVQDLTSLVKEKTIRGLYADSKKNIWIGTRYSGAFKLSPNPKGQFDIQHFNRQSGLMSDWISSFAETGTGDMWIGSYQGIERLVKETSGYRIFNLSKAVNFFAEIRKIIPAGKNEWICQANSGIAYFKDENLHLSKPYQPSILSASLGALENKLRILSPHEKISLRPNQNFARFEFSALGFINEKQILYSYRLRGSSDTSWSKPENIHEASYASLSPGHYIFQVRTIGWNGEYSTPATFSFSIATPFWKQWWFIGIGILLIAFLFFAFYRYRIRQLVRLQNVRSNIATDLHDDIGSSLTNISILSELSSKNLSHPEKAEPFLQRISEEVQASSQAMDDIIWSVNSRNDSLQETMARMRRYAAELFDNSDIDCHLQLDENAGDKKLSMEQRRDFYLIYKEALNNIRKHALAKNVWVNVAQNHNYLFMNLKDDGKGFNTNLITHRNGLKNLRSRVEKWNGKINIHSEEHKGTNIEIKIPLKE